ncbi:hypothetical protein EDB83DRAFT_2524726 [Lactarius deliciosus]|nr:hypothetical protein EDB83DRAFT_2524726 [Lactarius deliciosus]
MPTSRRGSGSVTLPSGQVLAIHHRTQDEEDLPHATKKTMADHLRKYETIFTLTPQRMRMIVEAFKDTLELGLEKPKQIVWGPNSSFSKLLIRAASPFGEVTKLVKQQVTRLGYFRAYTICTFLLPPHWHEHVMSN